ncbi:Uncharacterized protein dnm_080710 [Desulfonema magnum]|uniref:Uncharacterized protein n=1 Tax=Desulfonema magnum TaxID=45655 RepID=A0A975BVD9_9BACT|nr:Uncharacterized protein dnm_080710 [Desulfonema magnum]
MNHEFPFINSHERKGTRVYLFKNKKTRLLIQPGFCLSSFSISIK